jgi:hypothetical protein
VEQNKYIEALDELIKYYREKIDRLEELKLQSMLEITGPDLCTLGGECE